MQKVSFVSLHFKFSLHVYLSWKLSLHFKFSLHFVPGLSLHFVLSRICTRVLWFHSWVNSQILRLFCLHGRSESTTSPLISQLSGDSLQRTMHTWIAYSKLTIFSHILPKPASCSRQFTQNTSRSILASLLQYCWIMKRKQRPWRNTWSISWRHKQMKTSSKQKHLEILTSLLYGKVNCASKPSVRKIRW